MSHTKGSWKYRPQVVEKFGFYLESFDESGEQIAFIGDIGGGIMGTPEIIANAKLISAAPDLLDALNTALNAIKDIIRQLPNDENLADYNLDYCEIAEEKAIKAIKKATE